MRAHECHHCKQWVEEGEAHDCWTTTEAALTAGLSEDLRDAYERLRETGCGKPTSWNTGWRRGERNRRTRSGAVRGAPRRGRLDGERLERADGRIHRILLGGTSISETNAAFSITIRIEEVRPLWAVPGEAYDLHGKRR